METYKEDTIRYTTLSFIFIFIFGIPFGVGFIQKSNNILLMWCLGIIIVLSFILLFVSLRRIENEVGEEK